MHVGDITMASAVIGAAAVVTGGILRMVRATFKVASEIKDNSAAVSLLSGDIKDLRGDLADKITAPMHNDLIARHERDMTEVTRRLINLEAWRNDQGTPPH